MKKFVLKILIGIVIFLIPIFILNYMYVGTNYYRLINGTKKFEQVPYGIQVSNIGTSHGQRGFTYENCKDLVCFNFGLPSQTYKYDYYVLKNYIDHFAENAVLFIPVSYWSLYNEENVEALIEPVYYKFLNIKNIPDKKMDKLILYRWLPCLTAKSNIFEIIENRTPEYEGWEVSDNFLNADQMKAYAEGRAVFSYGMAKKDENNNPIKTYEVDYLRKIISLCKENHIRPIMVLMPYYYAYMEAFPEEFRNTLKKDLIQISFEEEIELWDYSDLDMAYDESYFDDGDHMNKKGRTYFSDIIMNDMEAAEGNETNEKSNN